MSFNWKSNYKLPLSFIVFFVLAFFLIGEQLPALPIYLFGPGVGNSGDKISILDLSPGDGLHRPLVYVLIGTVSWLLFRRFSWPVVWSIGATIAVVDQLFWTPLDHRPEYSGLFGLAMVIAAILFMWSLLTLVPYFIYKKIDQRWGGFGRRNAILVALAINILLLGFFAFQIFVLHHSYRGLHKNTGQQGSSDSTPRLPPNTCPERLVEEEGKHTVAYWNGKTLEVAEKD